MVEPNAPRIVIKHKGDLTKHGYRAKSSQKSRRRSLRKAVAEQGRTHVVRKLNALSVLNRNRSPRLSITFRKDMQFVQKIKLPRTQTPLFRVYQPYEVKKN